MPKGRPRTLDKDIPPKAKKVLKEQKVKLHTGKYFGEEKPKYDRKQSLYVFEGYNLLQNHMAVRFYMKKKHKIQFEYFEILLYLMPMNYFKGDELFPIPKQFNMNRIRHLSDKGYIIIALKGENKMEHIWTLSPKAKKMVEEYYKLLSGEWKIPEDAINNPMARPDACRFEQRKMEFIKLVNKKDPPENLKPLYQ